jgi:Flp pilus assembly protein CpaB
VIEGTDSAATFTQFVLTDIPVLALGQRIRTTTEQGTVDSTLVTNETVLMTLGLTEDQAEQLVFANTAGSLHVALLPEGFEPQPTQGRTFQNIFS